MYCRNCGSEMNENAAVCVKCGAAKGTGNSYCPNCGKETSPGASVCLNCGVSLAAPKQVPATEAAANDDGNFGWGVLGFCIPIVGLILYLVWKDSKPKSAKIAGKGALISVIIGVVFYVAVGVLGACGAAMMY